MKISNQQMGIDQHIRLLQKQRDVLASYNEHLQDIGDMSKRIRSATTQETYYQSQPSYKQLHEMAAKKNELNRDLRIISKYAEKPSESAKYNQLQH